MSDLERDLRGLDAAALFPRAPDIASHVERQLGEEPFGETRAAPARRPSLVLRAHPALAAGLALLVTIGTLLAVSSGARSAVLELLGLEGARIERGEPGGRQGMPPELGRKVSLSEARRLAGFDVAVPRLRELGPPRRVGFDERLAPGGQVILAWKRAPALAEPTVRPGPALVLTEIAATAGQVVGKVAPSDTRIEPLRVDGEPGYWLEGAPHQFSYLTRDEVVRSATTRLVGTTLLWERAGLLLRLEGAASKSAALAIARSIP